MVNNIKTEIIYHLLPTDFEFEFNLCGSCQMRLLTETAPDNTMLFKALQRSIKRSRVIIIVGNVTGEDNNIIALVSKAIGYNCEKINTKVYKVESSEDIILIENSVPLITDSGVFGGCIIECGPQSMIFLTKNKKIRKEIMKNLVHPYIGALSKYPVWAAESETEAITENIIEDNINEIIEQSPEENQNVNLEETDNADCEPESINDDIANIDENQESEDIPAEDEFEYMASSSRVAPEYDIDSNTYNINNISNSIEVEFDEKEQNKLPRHSGITLKISSLIIAIILLLLLIFIVYGYIYSPLKNGISISENFNKIFGIFSGIFKK